MRHVTGLIAPAGKTTTHILDYGPAGIWRGPLCGSRNINSHGGILIATCKRCLLIALKRADPRDYYAGVFARAVRRARKMGVPIDFKKRVA